MAIGDSVGEKAAQILATAGEEILGNTIPADLKQLSAVLQAFADHVFDRAEELTITITVSRKTT